MNRHHQPSILANKRYREPSVFLPENLLREARRQKALRPCTVPSVVVLDPDGDLTDFLIENGRARKNDCWACYHSTLYQSEIAETPVGILPRVVGAPYAVIVAEQLFVSGCRYLISVASAGIIADVTPEKRFALITQAVRDEGTSYHYLPPDRSAQILPRLRDKLMVARNPLWFEAKSWTTDAPYRETAAAIETMRGAGVTCVEMEAAALYAFSTAKQKNVLCFAHLTNTMAQQEGDFEKGENMGSTETLALIAEVIGLLG
jgi:uridine phosphorylase